MPIGFWTGVGHSGNTNPSTTGCEVLRSINGFSITSSKTPSERALSTALNCGPGRVPQKDMRKRAWKELRRGQAKACPTCQINSLQAEWDML